MISCELNIWELTLYCELRGEALPFNEINVIGKSSY